MDLLRSTNDDFDGDQVVSTGFDFVVSSHFPSDMKHDINFLSTQSKSDVGLSNQSSSGSSFLINNNKLFSRIINSSVTSSARKFLESVDNSNQASQALKILDSIDNILNDYYDLDLPQFSYSTADDGTIGLTLNLGNEKLGLAFSPDPNDSSWFILSGMDNRALTAFGNFSKHSEIEFLLDWLLLYIKRSMSHGK